MRRAARACALLLAAAASRGASAASFASPCDVSAIRPALPSARFAHCALLRPRGGADDATPAVRLLWRVDDNSGNVTLGVNVDAPLNTLGYVGIGASWNGGMKGAELWVASLSEAGAFSLRSFWSNDYVRPTARASDDASLLGWASVAREGTTWAFTRAATPRANDGGAASVPLLRTGGDIMLWALGGGDPGEFSYHGASLRGAKRVPLAAGAAPAAAEALHGDGEARVIPIVTPPIATDGTVSRYCWSWHKLPSDARYHITKVAPRLAHPELKSLVHHMVTYACPAGFEQGGGGADADALRAGRVVCRNEGSMVRARYPTLHAHTCAC
jgi:hypothetical protein